MDVYLKERKNSGKEITWLSDAVNMPCIPSFHQVPENYYDSFFKSWVDPNSICHESEALNEELHLPQIYIYSKYQNAFSLKLDYLKALYHSVCLS